MCLILFAYQQVPGIRLIALANRDEFYARPTESAHTWPDRNDIIAGKDLQSGGTWLGVTPNGRMAAVTNYRDGLPTEPNTASRGELPIEFLASNLTAQAYIAQLRTKRSDYGGFNLLLLDQTGLWHYCSVTDESSSVKPGVHGLSNHSLNTPWPKVVQGTWDLAQMVDGDVNADRLLELMYDAQYPEDSDLPDTGVGLDWERTLSPLFIQSPDYGTRSTTLVMVHESGRIEFAEVTHPQGRMGDPSESRRFVLNPD